MLVNSEGCIVLINQNVQIFVDFAEDFFWLSSPKRSVMSTAIKTSLVSLFSPIEMDVSTENNSNGI